MIWWKQEPVVDSPGELAQWREFKRLQTRWKRLADMRRLRVPAPIVKMEQILVAVSYVALRTGKNTDLLKVQLKRKYLGDQEWST